MERKNRGFTLIELIVTIAIMGIFSGVVLTVIGTGANSYRSTSSNAKAQMETQEVMDQIQNMIIDVNRSVYYAYGEGINQKIGSEIRNDIDSTDNSQSKTFFACSATELNAQQKKYAYSCDVIEWDSSDQKLYYACRTWEGEETETTQNGTKNEDELASYSADGELTDGGTDTSDGNGDTNIKSKRTSEIVTKVSKTLLADNITNFCVDISKAESERIVRFQFTTDKNGKEITTIHTVNLRNQVQIGEPGEGYGTSDSDKPWIKITNYPSEIKPGETLSGFSKLMNGNIDPSTVKWVVDSNNGTIIGQEDSAVSLTADQNASGEISVYVQAQTTDGKTVVSQIVKISVKEKEAKELITDTKELLLGVGNSYALSKIVKWRIEYNDGTKSNSVGATDIQWSTTSNLVTLGKDGNIAVPENLGEIKSNSTFEIAVSYKDTKTQKTLTNTLPVKLARLDLVQPTGIFHVGDTMPFEYVYKEGGESKTLSDAQIVKSAQHKKNMTASGTFGQAFTADDVGEWTTTAEVDLSKCSGYGKLKAESSFKVEAAVINQEIKIDHGSVMDTIVGGQEYTCSYYNQENFYFPMPLNGDWEYEITWNIKSKTTDSVTGFKNRKNTVKGNTKEEHDNNKDVILVVGADEQGFILTADMTVFHIDQMTGERSNEYKYHGELNVKVITNIKVITPTDHKVVRGRTYDLKAELCVWSVDENNNHTESTLENGSQYVEWQAKDIQKLDNTKKTWTIEDSQGDVMLEIWINNQIPNVKNAKPNNLMVNYSVKVENAPCTLELKDSDENMEKEIYPDETIDLSAILKVDGKDYVPKYGISWKCTRQNEILGNVLSGDDSLRKSFSLPEHMKTEGTYQITVSYKKDSYDVVSNIYIVKVKKYAYTLELKDSDGKTGTEIYPDEKIDLSAIMKRNGEKYIPQDGISWNCIMQSTNDSGNNALSGNDLLKKTFSLPDYMKKEGTYQITASYKKDSYDVVSNVYVVRVKKYQITANIVAVNNKTMITPGESTKIYLNLENEKGKTTASVNWSCNNDAVTYSSTRYQWDVLADDAITITAYNNDIKEQRTDTWTAKYTLRDGDVGTKSINITIVPK